MFSPDMDLFLFLIAMANVIFVLGLYFSVLIKNMAALIPAFGSAALMFLGAYIEFYEHPYAFVSNFCLGVVGLGYLIWGIYYRIKSRVRPDKRGEARFLVFIGLVGMAACYFVNTLDWPLKFDQYSL